MRRVRVRWLLAGAAVFLVHRAVATPPCPRRTAVDDDDDDDGGRTTSSGDGRTGFARVKRLVRGESVRAGSPWRRGGHECQTWSTPHTVSMEKRRDANIIF